MIIVWAGLIFSGFGLSIGEVFKPLPFYCFSCCFRRSFSYLSALSSSLRVESSAFLRFLDLRALFLFLRSLYDF